MVGSSNRVESFPYASELEASLPIPTPSLKPLEVHKVPAPQDNPSLQSLKQRLSEVFFPDDPLHQFKNKSLFRKLVLALQYLFPIFQWGSEYSLRLLKSDAISGVTIASLAIPQGISYAKLAGLPPIIGLYSSFVPPLIYSVLGSSRDLAVGPVSIASLVMGSMLREVVSPDKEPILYLQLAFTATFFAGVFEASLGLLRLGFIVDFLSKPTLTGFMGGAAIIVSLQQLKGLLGIVHFTTKMGIIPVMQSVLENRTEWAWQTVVMGLSFLVFLLVARHISSRRPKLFWVSAAAPLTSVILSTVLSFIFKAQNHGIKTIGHLQKGVNPPSVNMLFFRGPYLSLAIRTGIITGILALTEGMAVGRTFASLKNYQIDGNKEMVALGAMNMAGSCASCYITSGSFSRSAVNYNAGCKTAVSNIVMASAVLFTMLFLMPLFYYTPNVMLSAIIIVAVIGLIDVRGAFLLWKVDKFDFLACMSAFFGVLLISVQTGLAIAVGVSLFKILVHVTRPNTVIMGNVPGTNSYRNLAQYREAIQLPSFLILGIESPIYFTNSIYLQERILRWVREEEEKIKKLNESSLKCIILDMAAVTAIDISGLETLAELKKTLDKRSIDLVLANPVLEVAQKLSQLGTWDLFGSERIYMTVGEAIAASSYKAQTSACIVHRTSV
ncbi:probable sulfate transporter 3.4 [Musa acuminata AAA Group]|uniref:probable sulfate transporter 3.4 n=1 Tax=Musa acuminata AAA Group TaxID=214697 RepID=UPI0031E286FF